MNLQATIEIYAGGSGSGCRGPNCGRPSSGKSSSTVKGVPRKIAALKSVVDVYASKFGKKKLAISYSKLEKWDRCNHDYKCDDKKAGPLAVLYSAAGVSQKQAESYFQKVDDWTGNSNNKFAKLAQKVIAGKLNDPIVRAMAVDSLVTQKILGKKSLTLYRGIGGDYATKALNSALQKDQDIVLKSRGADSWTDKQSVASGFGQVVISTKVPASYIISSYKSNAAIGDMGEREYIVAFPKGKIPIQRRGGLSVGDLDSEVEDPIEIDLTDDDNFNWLHSMRNK